MSALYEWKVILTLTEAEAKALRACLLFRRARVEEARKGLDALPTLLGALDQLEGPGEKRLRLTWRELSVLSCCVAYCFPNRRRFRVSPEALEVLDAKLRQTSEREAHRFVEAAAREWLENDREQ